VTLSVSFDDDERPDLTADEQCGTPPVAGETAQAIDWLACYDATAGDMKPITGRIYDTTATFTRSGTLRFSVPMTVGPIPAASWQPMRAAGGATPLEACLALGETMRVRIDTLAPLGTLTAGQYSTVLDAGILAAKNQAATTTTPVAHPLDPALRAATRVQCWLRVTLPATPAGAPPMRLRMVTLNAVHATHATTVRNEVLGRGTGRPGQEFALAHGNVLDGTLELAVQESVDPAMPLIEWKETDSLEAADPFASVYSLDREAGVIDTGDGRHGRILPLVPSGGDLVALRYRYGGGLAGEVGVGAITVLESGAPGVAGVVNATRATGGRDAETLEQAKVRVRKEISSRSRAVTADDFRWIAEQTPDVRVARAEIVPLRRPLARSIAMGPSPSAPSPASAPLSMRCGAVPAGPLGLDTRVAPGAVSVIVIPDEAGSEPVPTRSFLRAVCKWLDAHRLVTTEVHVVPPQYCRFCDIQLSVQARAGYTRSQLQDLVSARLSSWLHPLTGGDDGKGFPFGGQVHIADLVALVTRTEGVDRVDSMSAWFTRTRSLATPRQGQLVLCPSLPDQVDRIQLGGEECVSMDATSLTLSTVL
jgi:predicted phage baseplate assembly protein